MSELEQLRADLATLEAANEITIRDHGYSPIFLDELIRLKKAKIAELESQPVDEWTTPRIFVEEILSDTSFSQRIIWLAQYARHLEARVAELEQKGKDK